MCMNCKYSEKEQRDIAEMTQYAMMVLQGVKPEDIALDEHTTVEHVEEMLKKIEDINPYLYNQVKTKLGR